MTRFLLAALAVLACGLLGAGNADAAWQDTIFGTNAYSRSDERPARAERRAARSNDAGEERSARRSTRSARVERSDDDERPVQSRRGRSSDSEGSSAGSGMASYYWQPQRVASGGWFNPNAMTAAHKSLPFGTRVRVTNQNNGQSVEVVINDRGPYVAGRVIDLSSAAAGAINMKGSGVVPVSLRVLGR